MVIYYTDYNFFFMLNIRNQNELCFPYLRIIRIVHM